MDPENQNLKDLKDPEGYPKRIPRGPKKDQHKPKGPRRIPKEDTKGPKRTNIQTYCRLMGLPGLGLETINFIILQFRGEKTKRR